MRFSAKQRCLIIKLYYVNNKSYARVRAQFSEEYPEIELSDMQINGVIIKFETQHTVQDLPKTGRPRVQMPALREQVRGEIEATPLFQLGDWHSG